MSAPPSPSDDDASLLGETRASESLAGRQASANARAEALELPAGRRVGRYRLDGVLGKGAMATVYSARDLTLHRPVALKLIRAGGSDGDDAAVRRLVREAQTIAKISHPNVIHVYDAGWEDNDLVYIAMELLAGTTLDRWLRSPWHLSKICGVMAAAGRGLAAAHDAGLIHRDFKPQNVLVGDDGQVRVLDFGLACAADPDREIDSGGRMGGLLVGVAARATAAGALVGTPAYMSPEQWRGVRADARGDQFAFCVSLFEAVAGRHPFDVSSRAALRESVLSGARAPWASLPNEVPRRLRRLLERGLSVDPEARFSSMHELVAELPAAPPPHTSLGASLRGLRYLMWAGAAALAIALVVLLRHDGERATKPQGSPAAERAAVLYRSPERLTARGDVALAALSPDEQTLAYLTADSLIVQPLRRDGEPRVLLRGRLGYEALAWSPDGTELALVAAPDAGEGDAASREPPALRLIIVDVPSGSARAISQPQGAVALIGEGELVAARFTDRELAFYGTRASDAGAAPRRRCALPGEFSGIRALAYQPVSRTVLVQLDRGDRESAFLRVDRLCQRIEEIAPKLQALSFAMRSSDEQLLVRLMYRRELVEVGDDGQPSPVQHLLQSAEYTPIAMRRDGKVVHQNSSARWQLFEAGKAQPLLAGADDSRFAFSPDGSRVAHIEGVYRDGILRVGGLDALLTHSVQIAEGAARTSWSPDGARLAILLQTRHGYELALWDRASGELSERRHPLALPYDGGMTWLDDRRVAFGAPPAWRGFPWLDPETGATGVLDVGEGEATRALARAPKSGRLAFLTEQGERIALWVIEPATATGATPPPRKLAEVAMEAPFSARQPRLLWSHDGATLLLYDSPTGELWKIDAATGAAERRPTLESPEGGGFTRVSEMFSLADRMIFATVTSSADLYLSAPAE